MHVHLYEVKYIGWYILQLKIIYKLHKGKKYLQ